MSAAISADAIITDLQGGCPHCTWRPPRSYYRAPTSHTTWEQSQHTPHTTAQGDSTLAIPTSLTHKHDTTHTTGHATQACHDHTARSMHILNQGIQNGPGSANAPAWWLVTRKSHHPGSPGPLYTPWAAGPCRPAHMHIHSRPHGRAMHPTMVMSVVRHWWSHHTQCASNCTVLYCINAHYLLLL